MAEIIHVNFQEKEIGEIEPQNIAYEEALNLQQVAEAAEMHNIQLGDVFAIVLDTYGQPFYVTEFGEVEQVISLLDEMARYLRDLYGK